MTKETLKPRVYVTCLAAHYQGSTHGIWIEVEGDAWHLWGRVRDMLMVSPSANADGFSVDAYEDFGSAKLARDTGLDVVANLAARLRH